MTKQQEALDQLEGLSVESLKKMRHEVKELLGTLEDDYRKAAVSEKSYTEVKKKNTMKLDKVKEILFNMGITDESDPDDIPSATPAAPAEAATPAVAPAAPQAAAQVSPTPAQTAPAAAPPQPVPVVAPVAQAIPLPTAPGVTEQKFTLEMEKLKVLLDSIKETRASTEDKILRLTEGLGELRSIVYQREGMAKDQDIKVEKLTEQVSELNPENISKEFARRDKSIGSHDMQLEKMDFKVNDLMKNFTDIRALLKSIGGLENISSVNKTITEKVTTITEKAKTMERLSTKIESMFVDLNKKMEDFFLYKAKQDTIDELVKELMKTSDSLSYQLNDYVTKQDFSSLKEDISSISLRLSDMKRLIDMVVPIIRLKVPEKIQMLQKEKEDVERLLVTLDDSFRKGGLPKSEYQESKKKNQARLRTLVGELNEEWKTFEFTQEPAKPQPPIQPAQPAPVQAPVQVAPTQPAPTQVAPATEVSEQKPASAETAEEPKAEPIEAAQKEAPEQKTPEKSKDHDMLADLQDSLDKGLISKEAFERAKKMLGLGGGT